MEDIESFEALEPSFRDPSGFIFKHNDILYRCVKYSYKEHFEYFINSDLSSKLINENLLLPFSLENSLKSNDSFCILKPKYIKYISYPYEWSFSQLKDAALLTLNIAKTSLDFGMILKDASAYNVQFVEGIPQFIDTLSFEKFEQNVPWIAYRQFCQHFLAPLLLMQKKDIHLNSMLKIHIDGIPIEIANKLLGLHSFLPSAFFHIYLQSRLAKNGAAQKVNNNHFSFSKQDHLKIIDNLFEVISKLQLEVKNNEWSDYYESKILNNGYLEDKQKTVSAYLSISNSETIYDFGANTGLFSRIASNYASQVISADIDPECVELNYRKCKENGDTKLLPLILDLTNPAPAIGWNNLERDSFYDRMKNDTIMALALVHHLVISNNIPFSKLAFFFSKKCKKLLIEFIPLNDPKVQLLLKNRSNLHENYTQSYFEEYFKQYFEITRSTKLKDSDRVLYLMIKKNE